MVRSMALADVCTLIADLGTELAEGIEPRGVPAHPAGTESTNITTIATKARTLRHEFVTMMLGHADHVICAGLARLSASKTGINAVLLLLRQRVRLHDSISLDMRLSMMRFHKQVIDQFGRGLLIRLHRVYHRTDL